MGNYYSSETTSNETQNQDNESVQTNEQQVNVIEKLDFEHTENGAKLTKEAKATLVKAITDGERANADLDKSKKDINNKVIREYVDSLKERIKELELENSMLRSSVESYKKSLFNLSLEMEKVDSVLTEEEDIQSSG